jgi:CelD/BcsL family acetyltransferase involved in cellulose biosynthesis
MSARAVPVDPLAAPRWDTYVRAHPHWTVYQLGAWAEILRAAYRFEPRYLALEDAAGALRGVLPLLYKKGLVSDARLRSLPVFPAGGPLGDSHDDEIALIEAARDAAAAVGVQALAVISPADYTGDLDGFTADLLPPRWVVEVGDDPDALRAGWRKTSNNLFRSLKKADKAGFRFREATADADLRAFYRLYLRTMRKHRTLPRSLRQLRLTRDLLGPGEFRLFVVEREDRLAAAGVFHVWGDTVELIYNGSDDALLDLRPNHALYWGVIGWCAAHGHRHFDFGEASPTTSLGRFKSQWAEPVSNHRYTWRAGGEPSRAESIAAASYEVEQGEGGLLGRVWQRTPVQLTRLGATVAYRYL